MRKPSIQRTLTTVLLLSCGPLLGCMNTGDVGIAVQSSAAEVADAATPDSGAATTGACPSDCGALGRVCHPLRLTCVGCLDDTQCVSGGGAPFCDRGRGECIECREHADCPRGAPLCAFGRCMICPDGRDHDGVCDFDPRCPPGRDCDGLPGQRGGRFGAGPNDHDFDHDPPDAGR